MYEVIIKRKQIEEVPAGREWTTVDETPLKTKDLQDSYFQYNEKDKEKFTLKPVYGYTPEIIIKKEVERIILRQEVEDLPLTEVIKAINGI